MNDSDEFTQLDDPAVIAERARIRELLEFQPECAADPELLDRYERITEEFDRRAKAAWAAGSWATGGGQ